MLTFSPVCVQIGVLERMQVKLMNMSCSLEKHTFVPANNTTITCSIKIAKNDCLICTGERQKSIIRTIDTKEIDIKKGFVFFLPLSRFHCWCIYISFQDMQHLIFFCCGIWNLGSLGMVGCFIDLKTKRSKTRFFFRTWRTRFKTC